MATSTRRATARFLCGLLSSLTAAVLAQDDGTLAGGEKAQVTVKLLATRRGGATNEYMTMGPFPLGVGERLPSTTFAIEGPSRDNPGGCQDEMTMSAPVTVLADRGFVWAVDVEVLSASTDEIVLDVDWKRLTEGEAGEAREVASNPGETLTLEEGDRVLLDYVDRGPDAELRCARSYAVELSASIGEDPALARRRAVYELWLLHEEPGGHVSSQYTRLSGAQGEELAFEFPPQGLPSAVAEFEVAIQGTIRGRFRPDQSLDVSLVTSRTLRYSLPGEGGGVTGDGGRKKHLTLQPREVLRIDLPDTPLLGARMDHYARELEGHSYALVLRAAPVS